MSTVLIVIGLVLIALFGAPLFTIIGAVAMIAFNAEDISASVMMVDLNRIATNPTLVAIPLFTFAGYVLAESKAPTRLVNLARASEMFQDPRTENGTYVFVDARADEHYEAGHIPGAVQCDYYRIDYYFPEVMQVASNAEKIVVYCNGGDCEDSLYVCGELLKADIPRAHILLFKGGWQVWSKSGMPVETGRKKPE